MTLLANRLSRAAALAVMLAACGSSRAEEQATTIVVDGDVNHEAVHAFRHARGRLPSHDELLAIHRVWIDDELLYREGLKLSLDRASANRERVIVKALEAMSKKVDSSNVTDAELRRWFESRSHTYGQPARFDFEDAMPSRDSSEGAVRALAAQLNGGAPKDSLAKVRVLKGRPESNLVQSYGAEVAAALVAAPTGTWLPLRARDGWRAMRVIATTSATNASFETQREVVRRDWIAATATERRAAAMQALRQKYKIEFAAPFECPADE